MIILNYMVILLFYYRNEVARKNGMVLYYRIESYCTIEWNCTILYYRIES